MKENLLFIIRPNKICGLQLGNVFLFVQIYSIYTDFHQQSTTNRVQVNIPNEFKTFMGKTIHTLGVPMFIKLVTHCGVLYWEEIVKDVPRGGGTQVWFW